MLHQTRSLIESVLTCLEFNTYLSYRKVRIEVKQNDDNAPVRQVALVCVKHHNHVPLHDMPTLASNVDVGQHRWDCVSCTAVNACCSLN